MALHRLIDGWIREFQDSDRTKDTSYANQLFTDQHLIDAVFTVLHNHTGYQDLVEPICEQLLVLYRSGDEKLKHFVHTFLPAIFAVEIDSCDRFNLLKDKAINGHETKGISSNKAYESVKVLLLGMYNIETVDEQGKPIVRTFRLPILTKPSIYHEPSSLTSGIYHSSAMQLTESALQKHEIGGETRMSSFGPYPEIDSIVASTRMTVFTVLMKTYNSYITHVPRKSLESMCKLCIKTLRYPTADVSNTMSDDRQLDTLLDLYKSRGTRLLLSSSFLVELSYAVYFALFNSITELGFEALEVIHERAYIDLFPDVLLMTNAIRNSLEVSTSGQPSDGPMGISVALSPTSNTTSVFATVAKTAITNASFKTKKLPDDIPIVQDGESAQANTSLAAINEDEDGETTPLDKANKSTSSSKGLTPTLGKMNVKNLLREKKEKRRESRESKKHHHAQNENGEVKVPLKSVSDSTHDNDNGTVIEDAHESHSNKKSDSIQMKLFSKDKTSNSSHPSSSDQLRPLAEGIASGPTNKT